MSRRNGRVRPARRPPALNRYGSIQAYHVLLQRARRLGLDFGGRPTGVKQVGDKVFLYEDMGVGCVKPRVVKRVKPVSARRFTPSYAWA